MTTFEEKLKFLYAPRFWVQVIGCLTIAIGPDGIPTGPEVYQALLAFSGLFIGIQTVDKFRKAIESKDTQEVINVINQEI